MSDRDRGVRIERLGYKLEVTGPREWHLISDGGRIHTFQTLETLDEFLDERERSSNKR